MSDIEDVDFLKQENLALKARILELEEKVSFLESHPIVSKGMKGESLAAKLLNASSTAHNVSHDLVIPHNKVKVEVKYSGLNIANRKVASVTQRWSWFNVLGGVSEKEYDYIVLIGDVDARFKEYYLDKQSPYVFFLVPKDQVLPLTISTNNGRNRTIQLTTNPKKARSSASKLYSDYQVTIQQLENQFESII